MSTNLLSRALAAAGLTVLRAGGAVLPEAYPPPANPFLTDAPPLASTTLAQPAKVGLVWLAPVGSAVPPQAAQQKLVEDRKSTRLNSSHDQISYAVFCLKKKTEA